MTLEELNAIEARAAKATKGPWAVEYANIASADVSGPIDAYAYLGGRAQYATWDAEFIAAARSDVPALVAEVRRLRQQVAELEDEIDAACIERQ